MAKLNDGFKNKLDRFLLRSNGSQSSKRNIRGALDFSGLFPGGSGSSKKADAAPKLLNNSEADSNLWSRPSTGTVDLGDVF